MNENAEVYEEVVDYLQNNDIDVKSVVSSLNLSSQCKLNRFKIIEVK